jgi:hypothetical protein
MEEIKETEWRHGHTSQLVELKFIYACKNGKCFIATATKTDVNFSMMPTNKGATIEMEAHPNDDYKEQKQKVIEWLHAQM